jgi:glutathione S-transferase
MILIGRNLSPYTRRCAVALRLLGIPFEHRAVSVWADPAAVAAHNPLVRVPALVLDDGEVLFESGAILDHLMERAGPVNTLIPVAGWPRRECLRLLALGTGTTDKVVAAVYEQQRRPPEKVHAPWLEHVRKQAAAGFAALEAAKPNPWLMEDGMTMADVTAAVLVSFTRKMEPVLLPAGAYPKLEALTARLEARPEFAAQALE